MGSNKSVDTGFCCLGSLQVQGASLGLWRIPCTLGAWLMYCPWWPLSVSLILRKHRKSVAITGCLQKRHCPSYKSCSIARRPKLEKIAIITGVFKSFLQVDLCMSNMLPWHLVLVCVPFKMPFNSISSKVPLSLQYLCYCTYCKTEWQVHIHNSLVVGKWWAIKILKFDNVYETHSSGFNLIF